MKFKKTAIIFIIVLLHTPLACLCEQDYKVLFDDIALISTGNLLIQHDTLTNQFQTISIDEYKARRDKINNAIIQFYKSDTSVIDYLIDNKDVLFDFSILAFKNDFYNPAISILSKEYVAMKQFYDTPEGMCLTFILNYYISVDRTKIQLIFDMNKLQQYQVSQKDSYEKLIALLSKHGKGRTKELEKAIIEAFQFYM